MWCFFYLIKNFDFDSEIRKKLQEICNFVEDEYIFNFEGYSSEELNKYDIEEETCEISFLLSK